MTSDAESTVHFLVSLIETHTDLRVPDANNKNTYTRACWLLAVHQKADAELGGKYPGVSEIILHLEKLLPELRKAHQ